ncbi:hypothetical protein ACXO9V_08950, partial [Lactobacillus delbrueckii subsp. bulgaricus]|nr:hypothetical protein [Lactobacillus delbrueckii subsp. bulgaricus]
ESVSSAANQTGQKVSSSNNKSHEAKAYTTSAASGSVSQVSGSNGAAITGLRHYGNNKLEYYGKDHVQYRN